MCLHCRVDHLERLATEILALAAVGADSSTVDACKSAASGLRSSCDSMAMN